MAHEGKQDEDKQEFTPEGEALGYISLDQARVLALQHARDNREIYRRYADAELVWDVVSAKETEDFYEVRLSYRPARAFRGRLGIEQFTIDKTGSVEFRQILQEPRPSRRRTVLGISVVLAVGVAIFVGLSFRGAQSSPSAESEEVTNPSAELTESPIAPATAAWFFPITPDTRLEWAPLDGDVGIALEAGSVDRVLGIEFELVSEIPPLPAGFIPSGNQFDLSVQPDHDSLAIPYTFLKPVTIAFHLSASEVTLARGIESNVVIQHFKDGTWTLLPTVVELAASIAQTEVDNLSIFALTVKEVEPTPASTTFPTATSTLVPTVTTVPALIPTSLPISTAVPTSTPSPVPTAIAIPTPIPTLVPSPTPTASPVPTPSPPVKPQSRLSTLTPTPNPFLTYVHPTSRWQIDYPRGWEVSWETLDSVILRPP